MAKHRAHCCRYISVERASSDLDEELEMLESRWRQVSDVVLAAVWLLVAGAIVFIPLGVVADTDCGSLLDHTPRGSCSLGSVGYWLGQLRSDSCTSSGRRGC